TAENTNTTVLRCRGVTEVSRPPPRPHLDRRPGVDTRPATDGCGAGHPLFPAGPRRWPPIRGRGGQGLDRDRPPGHGATATEGGAGDVATGRGRPAARTRPSGSHRGPLPAGRPNPGGGAVHVHGLPLPPALAPIPPGQSRWAVPGGASSRSP